MTVASKSIVPDQSLLGTKKGGVRILIISQGLRINQIVGQIFTGRKISRIS